MKKQHWVFLLVILANSWFWRVIKLDFVVGILIIVLNILLFILILQKHSRKVLFSTIIIFFIISIFSLKKGSDRGIFIIQPLERDQIEKRHEYYANNLGRLYKNRFALTYFKRIYPVFMHLQKNLFSNLDISA